MSWDYRAIRKVLPDGTVQLGIHEVYYGPEGLAEACTEEPVRPVSDSLEGLRRVAIMWIAALKDAVLEYDYFAFHHAPFGGHDDDPSPAISSIR